MKSGGPGELVWLVQFSSRPRQEACTPATAPPVEGLAPPARPEGPQ